MRNTLRHLMENIAYSGLWITWYSNEYLPRVWDTHTWINNKRISFLILLLLERRRYIHVKEWSLHIWSKQTYLKREKKAIWIFCMFHAYMLPIRNCKGYLLQLVELYVEHVKGYPVQFIAFSCLTCAVYLITM